MQLEAVRLWARVNEQAKPESLKKKRSAAGEKRMTERMAVRTGRKVQLSPLHCNRNTLGYAAVLWISSCK